MFINKQRFPLHAEIVVSTHLAGFGTRAEKSRSFGRRSGAGAFSGEGMQPPGIHQHHFAGIEVRERKAYSVAPFLSFDWSRTVLIQSEINVILSGLHTVINSQVEEV